MVAFCGVYVVCSWVSFLGLLSFLLQCLRLGSVGGGGHLLGLMIWVSYAASRRFRGIGFGAATFSQELACFGQPYPVNSEP